MREATKLGWCDELTRTRVQDESECKVHENACMMKMCVATRVKEEHGFAVQGFEGLRSLDALACM